MNATASIEGDFIRADSGFRNWVTVDGSPGPGGSGGFAAAAGRYHLYVSFACPWAHRTLIYRKLKGLEDIVPVSVVHWHMAEHGWVFEDSEQGGDDCTGDRLAAAGRSHCYLLAFFSAAICLAKRCSTCGWSA